MIYVVLLSAFVITGCIAICVGARILSDCYKSVDSLISHIEALWTSNNNAMARIEELEKNIDYLAKEEASVHAKYQELLGAYYKSIQTIAAGHNAIIDDNKEIKESVDYCLIQLNEIRDHMSRLYVNVPEEENAE